ncbi:hypothetical protein Taro_005198, partial [Colocasia esculenta]|nr:hypothetical protein [Colocasia esculenta]
VKFHGTRLRSRWVSQSRPGGDVSLRCVLSERAPAPVSLRNATGTCATFRSSGFLRNTTSVSVAIGLRRGTCCIQKTQGCCGALSRHERHVLTTTYRRIASLTERDWRQGSNLSRSHQKVLRAHPALGHTLTRRPRPRKTPEADQVLLRPPKSSRYHHDGQGHREKTRPRQQHCRDGQPGRDTTLIAMANHATIRSYQTGATPSLMSRRAQRSRHQLEGRPPGCYISGSPTCYNHYNHGEGSMVKASKACIQRKELPITRIGKGTRYPYRFEEPKSPRRAFTKPRPPPHRSSPPLQLRHEPSPAPPSSKPPEEKGEDLPLLGEEEGREKSQRRKKGESAKAFSLRPPKCDGAGRRDTNLIATAA